MRSLAEWLAYQERQHPQAIDLGLERVRRVWQRMQCPRFRHTVIIAGTNGKGTAAHALDALARDAGWSTGRYTSPHLYRYNERVTLNGEPASDAQLCAAFEEIEQARADTSLTYFEYGTLAALTIFAKRDPDLVILEVGLGGRLDATNMIDADLAILCSVSLDHQDWLGDDLAVIAGEKAAVARSGKPAVVADSGSWDLYRPALERIGAMAVVCPDPVSLNLPSVLPPQSLVAAQRAWELISGEADSQRTAAVFRKLAVPGRLQRIPAGFGEYVLDVAHNPAAAQRLVTAVAELPPLPTALVLGVQADKDVAGICGALSALAEQVFVCNLPPPRGARATDLQTHFAPGTVTCCDNPRSARLAAEQWASRFKASARIIIAGSFVTVGESGLG